MNPMEHLFDLDPLINVRRESDLPPQTSCDRLSDVLALVEPRLGAALLDEPGRAALHHIAGRISTHLSPFWGLEVRLGDPAPRADILWEVTQENSGISTLAGRNPHDPAADVTAALRQRSPFWHEIGRFAEEWLDSVDWRRRLLNIWLEVDSSTTSSDTTLDAYLDRPSLFLGPNHRSVTGPARELAGASGGAGPPPLRAGPGPGADRRDHQYPSPGRRGCSRWGSWVRGAIPVVRLCVKGPGYRDDCALACRHRLAGRSGAPVRHPGPTEAPCAVKSHSTWTSSPIGWARSWGLRCTLPGERCPMNAWQPLHDELSARGLTRADKLAALEDFPSFQRYRQADVWLRSTPPLGYPVLATNLHHLKLVVVGDAAIEAKVYLGGSSAPSWTIR